VNKRKTAFFRSPSKLLAAVIAANFLGEMGVMILLSSLPRRSRYAEVINDPLLLVLLLFPVLILFVYRPLNLHLKERLRAEDALRESEKQLRYLSSQLLTAQERERRRISRELHDELGQALSLIKFHLRHIAASLESEQKGLRTECEDLLGYADTVIENVRRISRDLSPLILEDLGLTAALKWLVRGFTKTCPGSIASDIGDINGLFDHDSQMMIYRIVQEALANIYKHAGAENVSLVIRREEGSVSLVLQDDGEGFDPDKRGRKEGGEPGLGLATMAERVRTLGGILDIKSAVGAGSRISVHIPLPRGEEGTK